jgi:signal transduction histidine kinase
MRRVVFNLARNAREALAERGGRFEIGVEEVDGAVVFRFSDDGPGIPDEMRKQ